MWFQNIFRRKSSARAGKSDTAALRELSLSPRVLAHLDQLQIRSTQYLRGAGAGQRSSTRRRPASDFREHRKYVSGDDFRFVDWKASARSEQVFLKQGEQPQESTVHLLIDTSGSMSWGEPPKSHKVLRLASALGYLALSSDDRLNVVPIKSTTPGTINIRSFVFKGKGHFPTLLNTLRNLTFKGQGDLLQTVKQLSNNRRGGIVIILSDLLDIPALDKALSMLPRPTWETTLIHTLHPQELEPQITGDLQMEDVETGKLENYDINAQAVSDYHQHMLKWRNSIELKCVENNALYTSISTGWSLEKETLPYLHRVSVVEPV